MPPGGVTVDLTCGENVLNATVSSAQADAAQSFTFFIVRECDDEPEPGPEARPPPEVPAANRTANGTGEEGVTVEEERPARESFALRPRRAELIDLLASPGVRPSTCYLRNHPASFFS